MCEEARVMDSITVEEEDNKNYFGDGAEIIAFQACDFSAAFIEHRVLFRTAIENRGIQPRRWRRKEC
jgi:hypothetical protein